MSAWRGVAAVLVCAVVAGCGARHDTPAPDSDQVPTSTRVDVDDLPTATTEAGSVDGAVEAAVRFVCSGQRLLDTPPPRLAEAVRSSWTAEAADGAVDATLDQLDALRERLATGVGPTRFRQAVLAVRVDAASDARVVVSIWWVGVLSRDRAVEPQAQWTTSTVTMLSEGGGWRVSEETSEPGPVPDHSVDGEPLAHAELERRLTGFVDWSGR